MSDMSHDVIISGGGMVGLATAIGLSQAGLRVAVLEKQPYDETPAQPDTFSARVSAINHSSEHLLRNLGAWEKIPNERRSVYRDMRVWDGLGTGTIDFSADDVQAGHLGHIIENRHIVLALLSVARTQPSLDLFSEETLTDWSQNDRQVSVSTSLGQRLSAPLLVGSEGKGSPVREQSGIDLWQWQYDQTALVTTVQHEHAHEATAQQVFLADGPLAFLPLQDIDQLQTFSSIVWSVPPQRAEHLLALSQQSFCRVLGEAFEHRLGKVISADTRASFPLQAQQAKHYFDGRVTVIGDAAHTIHPLAGLGVNLGFLDAGALIDAVVEAHRKQTDIGHAFTLRRFQRSRQSHNLAIAGLMESLKRGFTTQAPLPVLVRNTGLNLLNRISLLKRPLVQGALGDLGPALPSLCRPVTGNRQNHFDARPHTP